MKIKTISLMTLSLGVCAIAYATDYKAPSVGFKKATPMATASKTAEFSEDYKVEGATKADRGIASEKESEREPSSVVAADKKKVEDEKNDDPDKAMPRPWLYKTETRNAH